ncbi:hypothetical protein JCM8547_005385 [Rhodosporidiobolus lusitaniae]
MTRTDVAKPQDAKAKAAKKAALKGSSGTKLSKVRTSVTFHRPKTLALARAPKYQRKAVASLPRMDAYRTIVHPLNTESAMKKIEENNTLVFIVDVKANKRQIKEAVRKLYDVKAVKINTLIRPDGRKKAFVRLEADVDALDVANKRRSFSPSPSPSARTPRGALLARAFAAQQAHTRTGGGGGGGGSSGRGGGGGFTLQLGRSAGGQGQGEEGERSGRGRNPRELMKQLDEFVVGQERAKKVLSVAVYNHYARLATLAPCSSSTGNPSSSSYSDDPLLRIPIEDLLDASNIFPLSSSPSSSSSSSQTGALPKGWKAVAAPTEDELLAIQAQQAQLPSSSAADAGERLDPRFARSSGAMLEAVRGRLEASKKRRREQEEEEKVVREEDVVPKAAEVKPAKRGGGGRKRVEEEEGKEKAETGSTESSSSTTAPATARTAEAAPSSTAEIVFPSSGPPSSPSPSDSSPPPPLPPRPKRRSPLPSSSPSSPHKTHYFRSPSGSLVVLTSSPLPRPDPTLYDSPPLPPFLEFEESGQVEVMVVTREAVEKVRKARAREEGKESGEKKEKEEDLTEREKDILTDFVGQVRGTPSFEEAAKGVKARLSSAGADGKESTEQQESVEPPQSTFEKSNVLLLGPTGSGKSLLVRTLAKQLHVPFVEAEATGWTQAGYVGGDVESVAVRLVEAADGDVERAGRGIVFIDEVDKISSTRSLGSGSKDVGGEGVQQALLKMLEGTVINVAEHGYNPGGRGGGFGMRGPVRDSIDLDTSNVLFIVAGAFVGLEKIIQSRLSKGSIGFTSTIAPTKAVGLARPVQGEEKDKDKDKRKKEEKEDLSHLLELCEPGDLAQFGLIPEFIGRLPIVASLRSLTEADLLKVLTEPQNALIKQYETTLKASGVELRFTTLALKAIAAQAVSKGTGARGLRGILESVLLDSMFDTPGSSVRYVLVTRSTILGTSTPPSSSSSSSSAGARPAPPQKHHVAHYFSRGQKAQFESELARENAEDEADSSGPSSVAGPAEGDDRGAVEEDVRRVEEEGGVGGGGGAAPQKRRATASSGWEGGFP